MRPDWDTYFFDIAKMVATRATCPRKQVGVVIVDKNKRVIGMGYNGSRSGEPHCIDVRVYDARRLLQKNCTCRA